MSGERLTDVMAVAAGSVHGGAEHGTVAHGPGCGRTVRCSRRDGTHTGNARVRLRDVVAVAAGWRTTVGVLSDGRVVATGRAAEGQGDVRAWRDATSVSCGTGTRWAVRADGTTIATGNNRRGQCDVAGWNDIVGVAAGYTHTLGRRDGVVFVRLGRSVGGRLRRRRVAKRGVGRCGQSSLGRVTTAGRALAVGDNEFGQCEVDGGTDSSRSRPGRATRSGCVLTKPFSASATILLGKVECRGGL